MKTLNVLNTRMKVGIISCSGEELPGGTISRFACRKVLDDLRRGETVTICLPLFIAGGQEERDFAKTFPTITIDGCEKRCAYLSTERLSAKPKKSLVIPEILQRHAIKPPENLRNLNADEKEAVQIVAEELAKAVDEVLKG